jgi:Asp-tRNA(Asn)/Glu-tRNA(Gln) amidotransferase A subunit family amidase
MILGGGHPEKEHDNERYDPRVQQQPTVVMTKTMCSSTVWMIGIVAICVGLLTQMMELPIRKDEEDEILDGTAYNLIDVTAPAMTGRVLTMFAYLAARTPLGPIVIRHLLNQNGIQLLRQLSASSVLKEVAHPTYFPMTRLSHVDHEYHCRMAEEFNPKILREGIPWNSSIDDGGQYRSILDYHQLYQSRRAKPSQVMDQVLQGLETLQHLRMMRSVHTDQVRQQALESDARWEAGQALSLFDGVPVAFKDMMLVQGHDICSGSAYCHFATRDDALVAKFRTAGAIILGTTVMTEGGVTPLGYSLWSDGPFNPYDMDYYCGGSSSGSAVVVASGIVPLAIGFDGGGSVRVPASMSGVMGLAMTYGRIETSSGWQSTNVKAGPLAATVQDVALSHVFMSGSVNTNHFFSQLYDGGARGTPPAHLGGGGGGGEGGDSYFDSGMKGLRLGVYWDHFQHSDPEIVQKCNDALHFLIQSGASVQNITIPYLRQIQMSQGIKILSEFATIWDARFYDPNVTLEANTDITLAMGKLVTANEVLAAENIRTYAKDLVQNKLFRHLELDAIVSPMLGTKVPKPKAGYRAAGESNTPLVYKVMRFVPLSNFLGLPAMSVPIGYEEETGLPIGFQLLGDAWQEHKLLRIAEVLEKKVLQRRRPPSQNFVDPLATWL